MKITLLKLFLLGATTAMAATTPDVVEMDPYPVEGDGAPFSIGGSPLTTIGIDELQTVQFTSVTDIHALVPNLRVGSGGLRTFGEITQMRGIGNTPYFGSPGVSVIVDGVALGDAFANPALLPNVSEVIVYRGPQPTLSGRAAPAGTIIINSSAPKDKVTAYAEANFSRFDTRSLSANVSVPIVQEKLWITVSGRHEESDGFVYNDFLKEKTDFREGQMGSIKILWKPESSWELEAGASMEDYDDGSQRIVQTFNPWATDYSNVRGVSQSERNSQYLRASKEFDAFTVKVVLPRSYWELDPFVIDYDFQPYDSVVSTLRQEQEQYIPELKLESPAESDSIVSWRAGMSYTDAKTKGAFLRTFVFPLDDGSIFSGFEDTSHQIDEEAIAAYSEVTVAVLENLKLTGGLRLDAFSKTLHREKTTQFGPELPINLKKSDDRFSPVLAAQWEATEQLSFSARYAHSMQPGGFSAYTSRTTDAVFDSERVRAYEIGVSLNAIPDKFRMSLSVFHYDLRNYQVERSFSAADYLVVNAPEAFSRGIEFEMEAKPFSGMELGASLGYLKTEFETYVDPFTGVDFSGNRFPYAPEMTFALRAKYKVPEGLLKGVFASAVLRYTGATFYDEQETAAFEAEAYRLIDARLGYEQEQWGIYLYVENLLNEEYYTYILPELVAGVPGEPRMVGVGAYYRY